MSLTLIHKGCSAYGKADSNPPPSQNKAMRPRSDRAFVAPPPRWRVSATYTKYGEKSWSLRSTVARAPPTQYCESRGACAPPWRGRHGARSCTVPHRRWRRIGIRLSIVLTGFCNVFNSYTQGLLSLWKGGFQSAANVKTQRSDRAFVAPSPRWRLSATYTILRKSWSLRSTVARAPRCPVMYCPA